MLYAGPPTNNWCKEGTTGTLYQQVIVKLNMISSDNVLTAIYIINDLYQRNPTSFCTNDILKLVKQKVFLFSLRR